MPVPSGTSSPWRELPPSDTGDTLVYFRDGAVSGSADLLAEALRADGVIRSLGPAIQAAEVAELELVWLGYLDDGTEVLCDEDGETTTGEYADSVHQCIVARVKVDV